VQAVKVGIAGVVAILAARLLRLPQGYWAAISAFVVMGSDVRETVAASRGRFIGTAIGAALGAVFVIMGGIHLLWFGVAVAATVLICKSLGLGQSYRLACVTVAIVMLTGDAGSPWMISTHRFLEVSLGIVIALIISALPPRSVDNR
ncbi:MAG: FUSC family protein, partial [Terriglobales bacterium]